MAEYLHQKMVRFLYRKRTAHITLDGKQGTEENLNVKKLEIVPADPSLCRHNKKEFDMIIEIAREKINHNSGR